MAEGKVIPKGSNSSIITITSLKLGQKLLGKKKQKKKPWFDNKRENKLLSSP
jgi:hypothetical protein